MFNTIVLVVNVFSVVMCFSLCIAYVNERNTYRDKWICAVDRHKDHLVDENYDLRNTIDDLKSDIAELKANNKENNDA